MIPKIRVRPAASMNSSRPYWTLFSSWMRKLAKSIQDGVEEPKKWEAETSHSCARRASGHLAASAGVGQRLRGNPDHLVVLVLDAAQVDVLHRVVGRAHRPLAARAV